MNAVRHSQQFFSVQSTKCANPGAAVPAGIPATGAGLAVGQFVGGAVGLYQPYFIAAEHVPATSRQ